MTNKPPVYLGEGATRRQVGDCTAEYNTDGELIITARISDLTTRLMFTGDIDLMVSLLPKPITESKQND